MMVLCTGGGALSSFCWQRSRGWRRQGGMTDKKMGHFVVRARTGRYPFLDEARARWVWQRLQASFPDALAAILMPNHLHLLTHDGDGARRRLAAVVAASGRALGEAEGRGALWQPVEAPTMVDSPDKLRRSVRYVWLNCCRPWRLEGRWVQLVDDPLRWRWSTLHDSIGAIVDPWVTGARVARAFGWATGADVGRRLHAYATQDEHVADSAQVFPVAPAPADAPDRALVDVLEAALRTTRLGSEALRRKTPARRVAIGLAYRQGWRHPKGLAPTFGVHRATVCKIAARASTRETEAAALCLDPRLSLIHI